MATREHVPDRRRPQADSRAEDLGVGATGPSADVVRPSAHRLPGTGGPAAVLALQRSAGNWAVARALGHGVDRPFELGVTGAGQPLEKSTRVQLEGALGEDLSDVRVHEDGQAERASAQALASGSDLHFARGRYSPTTPEGFDLIAHEIAHVAQQRAGRVPSSSVDRLVSDPELESEADAFAGRARTAAPGRVAARSARVVQPNPVVAFLAALDAVALANAVNVVTLLGAGAGAVAGTYVGMQPGQNGFGALMLQQKLMTGQDSEKLEQIAQFEIINQYVERYLANERLAGQREDAAPGATPGQDRPTGSPTAEQIDEQVLGEVANATRTSLQTRLETNLAHSEWEYMWGEDNSRDEQSKLGATAGSREDFGVTGFLQFQNMQGVALRQTLALTDQARELVGPVPGDGTEVVVHRFWGGRVTGVATKSAFQSLTVNVDGGAAQESAAEGGSPLLIVSTRWCWDRWGYNTESAMESTIVVSDSGLPIVKSEYQGSPGTFREPAGP